MKKLLLVKITSMGDLIQMLPALTDAANAIPGIKFDWLVEESFQDIPSLHPAIDKIIPLPYRRWKKNLLKTLKSGELLTYLKTLRAQQYDMVIDAQSNIKSAVASLFAKGMRYGLDKTSVREYGAHFAYNKTITISRDQNHTERLRQLMARHLNYDLPLTAADYGIRPEQLPKLDFTLPEKFVFLIPIASCDNKLWPEPFWQIVIDDLARSGFEMVIPWYSAKEKQRAERLQAHNPAIHLLPSLNLAEKAAVLCRAKAAISIDTGLAHMAAALNIPNVCLYGPFDPKHCGTYGYKQIHLSALTPSCAPCISTKCSYTGPTEHQPACMSSITPQRVLEQFYTLV